MTPTPHSIPSLAKKRSSARRRSLKPRNWSSQRKSAEPSSSLKWRTISPVTQPPSTAAARSDGRLSSFLPSCASTNSASPRWSGAPPTFSSPPPPPPLLLLWSPSPPPAEAESALGLGRAERMERRMPRRRGGAWGSRERRGGWREGRWSGAGWGDGAASEENRRRGR
jgi:hypothetical protein